MILVFRYFQRLKVPWMPVDPLSRRAHSLCLLEDAGLCSCNPLAEFADSFKNPRQRRWVEA